MKKCWLLLCATIAIARGSSPDPVPKEKNIDAPRHARQTTSFSATNSNGFNTRKQPIPRRAIRVLDPNYVSQNFGTSITGSRLSGNSKGIPSPYLVHQNDPVIPNLFNGNNGNNNKSNNKNINWSHISQSYDSKQNSQQNVQFNENLDTHNNIKENLIYQSNFASNEDIHTDSDDINSYGLSFLSNDGLNSKRSVGVPLPQNEVANPTPQDTFVLGKDNNQVIIANENPGDSASSGSPSQSYGQSLPINNIGSTDRSSQQFSVQGNFESFGNQGGSFSSQTSSANNANKQPFITVRDEDSFETFGNNAASFGVPIPTPVNTNNYDSNNKDSSISSSSGGNVGGSVSFGNNENNYQNNNNQNQGQSTGIPLPSIVTDSNNNNKYSDNVQGESIQGGSIGIPLPSSITSNAGQSQDNIQVDSVINAINGLSNGNQGQIENLIGGMTIGELLNGINGQNGIMVLPASKANGLASQFSGNSNNKISIREGSDEVVVVSSPSTSTPTTTEAAVTRARSSRRRTTTPPPDHLRRSLSDLLYAKGQWFGTLIGGLIDYGSIVQEAYKKTLGNDSPRQPYAS